MSACYSCLLPVLADATGGSDVRRAVVDHAAAARSQNSGGPQGSCCSKLMAISTSAMRGRSTQHSALSGEGADVFEPTSRTAARCICRTPRFSESHQPASSLFFFSVSESDVRRRASRCTHAPPLPPPHAPSALIRLPVSVRCTRLRHASPRPTSPPHTSVLARRSRPRRSRC